jgi:hypothetical protein
MISATIWAGASSTSRRSSGRRHPERSTAAEVALYVKEEIFNATGLVSDPIGDASLFDDPWGRGTPDPMVGATYARRDAVLWLLHHPSVRAGMSREVVLDALDELRRGCRIP